MSEEEFIKFANKACKIIGEETGKYFYVKRIRKCTFDIFLGSQHIIQSDDYGYLLGFLNGMKTVFRGETEKSKGVV